MATSTASAPDQAFTPAESIALEEVFAQLPWLERVVLFGSRAKGVNARYADVDLAIVGGSEEERAQLAQTLEEETTLPYFFDVIRLEAITSPELREHISRHGIVLYERNNLCA